MMMSRRMWMAMMLCSDFVISRLFNLFPLVEVPVERFGVPGLGPELDNVGIRHLAGLKCFCTKCDRCPWEQQEHTVGRLSRSSYPSLCCHPTTLGCPSGNHHQ